MLFQKLSHPIIRQLEFLGFCVKVKPVQIILAHNGLKLFLKKYSYLELRFHDIFI